MTMVVHGPLALRLYSCSYLEAEYAYGIRLYLLQLIKPIEARILGSRRYCHPTPAISLVHVYILLNRCFRSILKS